MTDLQAALTAAKAFPDGCKSMKIWVAAGTYIPTSTGQRGIAFELGNNISLYGGFAGTETAAADADPSKNPTYLSGDLNGDDGADFTNYTDNSYNVVTGSDLNTTCLVDGFTIRSAYNDKKTIKGGGMYLKDSSIRINAVRFVDSFVVSDTSYNGGGGLHVWGGDPVITNSLFQANRLTTGGSYNGGGGVYLRQSEPTFRDVDFIGNRVDDSSGNPYRGGGGLFSFGDGPSPSNPTSPVLINVLFRSNRSGDHGHQYSGGGGIMSMWTASQLVNAHFTINTAPGDSRGGGLYQLFKSKGSPSVINATFEDNTAGNGGDGIYSFDTNNELTVTNSIFIDSAGGGDLGTITYSCTYPGTIPGNTNGDCGANALEASFEPKANSFAHNGGDNSANAEDKDLAGNPRKVGTIDMGAYERQ